MELLKDHVRFVVVSFEAEITIPFKESPKERDKDCPKLITQLSEIGNGTCCE